MNYFIIKKSILDVFTEQEYKKIDLFGLRKKTICQGNCEGKTESIFLITDFSKIGLIKDRGIITDKNGANEYMQNNWLKHNYNVKNPTLMQVKLEYMINNNLFDIMQLEKELNEQQELEILYAANVSGIERVELYTLIE